MTTDDGMDVVVTETPSATIARQAAEIERLRAELDDQRKDTVCDEQRVADMMADVQRLGVEIERLRAQLAATEAGALSFRDTAEIEFVKLRGTLREIRIRLHAAGRRPEECYEMSLIDEALGGKS